MTEYGKIITLGQSIFSERAAESIAKQPLRRTVNLAEIELVDDEHINYKGSPLKITKTAFSDMMKILKIPTAFITRFNEVMDEKPEAKRNFINAIKNVISSRGTGGRTITLVLNQSDRTIIAVHKTNRNLISNTSFMDVVSQVIDENSLSTIDFSVDNAGRTVINALNTKAEFNIGGHKDEYFHGGVSFSNDPKNGFIVSPYVNRLTCANGMVGRSFQEVYKLTSTDAATTQKFFGDLAILAKSGYKPELFVNRVEEAMELRASLSEMYSVRNAIKRVVPEIKPLDLETWVPVRATEAAYMNIGVDTKLLRNGQLKNAKTGTTVWQLINGLTEFASHHNGFEMDDYSRRILQVEAGKMLSNEKDMANFVRTPNAFR